MTMLEALEQAFIREGISAEEFAELIKEQPHPLRVSKEEQDRVIAKDAEGFVIAEFRAMIREIELSRKRNQRNQRN